MFLFCIDNANPMRNIAQQFKVNFQYENKFNEEKGHIEAM